MLAPFSVLLGLATAAAYSLPGCTVSHHQRAAAVTMQVPKTKGIEYLSAETIERAKAGNPIEKAKLAKDGTEAFTDIYEFAAAIRAGSLTWEEIEKSDMDTRLKWVGLLHRAKRTPGRFMMRLRTPNGLVSSSLWRFYADCVEPYGEEMGVVDITTRANIQVCAHSSSPEVASAPPLLPCSHARALPPPMSLPHHPRAIPLQLRGITVEDAPTVIDGLHARNQTSFQSALDNVRNMVGSPLAGIDPIEMV